MNGTMKDYRLKPEDVARAFGVCPKTVSRWAKAGKIPHIVTPGGHRRYNYDDIQEYMQKG